jgi:hypothetical protein
MVYFPYFKERGAKRNHLLKKNPETRLLKLEQAGITLWDHSERDH